MVETKRNKKRRDKIMARIRSGSKSTWSLFFFILCGIVLGGFLGSLADGVSYLKWVNFGYSFGMKAPTAIDLKVIYFQFQLLLDISIASLLGVAISIFIYRKL